MRLSQLFCLWYKPLTRLKLQRKRKRFKAGFINEPCKKSCTQCKKLMISLFNYLLIFNIFGCGFRLLSKPFDIFISYIFIIWFLIIYILHYYKISINRKFLIALSVLIVFSLINVYLGNDTIFLMSKQVFGILISSFAYYLLVKVNKYEIDKLFKIYLQIALIVAIIGVFQEFSFLVGFEKGYDYRDLIPRWTLTPAGSGLLRVNSILMEPSHFAISMTPALFVSLVTIFRNNSLYYGKIAAIIVIISVILTFSAVAYSAILLSLILIFLNVRKIKYLLLLAVILPVFIYAAYNYAPGIRIRVDDTFRIISKMIRVVDANASTYALGSNIFVAYKSFIQNPLFGSGLGSHPLSYDKFLHLGISDGFWQANALVLNREDAASLFIRLVSETGLFGVAIVLIFIFNFFLKDQKKEEKSLYIINNSIFCIFFMHLARYGHYFGAGLFFFIWLYYFTYKISKTEEC